MTSLEAELLLCLAILNADEEINDREVAFAVRHLLARFPEKSHAQAISLIRKIHDTAWTTDEATEKIRVSVPRRDMIAMMLSFMGIVYTDGAHKAELKLLEQTGVRLGFEQSELRRMIGMFHLNPDDFYDDDTIIVIGSWADRVNIPLIDNPAAVLIYLDGEDLFIVVRSNAGMALNSSAVPYDFFTALFEEDSYISFCNNRHTFDYWNIRSFLRKEEPGKGRHIYSIDEVEDRLSVIEGTLPESLALVVHEKNLIHVTPSVSGFHSGSLDFEAGKTYRLCDREYIQSHRYKGVLQFVIEGSGEHRVALSRDAEITLGDFDSTLPEDCRLHIQWSGNRAEVSVDSETIRFDGNDVGSLAELSGGSSFIISRLLVQLPENEAGEVSIKPLKINTVQADQIGVRFGKSERRVIDDISFTMHAGELNAILGPAGSGKSTLLNSLLGTQELETGSIRVNGNPCEKALMDISDFMGFVPQDDLLIDVLTVRENLYYSFKLKNTEQKYSEEDIETRINRVLSEVGLSHKANSRVGNETQRFLSGGERRRLNIALELISDPDIVILDEPTSGLSSMDAENLVGLLRRIANSGKLLFMVIHQPSSAIYRMLDNTLILNKDGRLAFYGSNMRALTLFSEIDADSNTTGTVECPTCHSLDPNLLLKALDQETEAFWQVSRELHSITGKETGATSGITPPATALPEPRRLGFRERLREFRVQFTRLFLRSRRDTSSQILTLVISPLFGLLTGLLLRFSPEESYIFPDNPHYQQYLFLVVIAAMFFGLSSSIAGILNDRLILKREQITRMSRGIYLLSKNLVVLAFTSLQCMMFLLPAHLTLGDTTMVLPMLLLMLMISYSTVALGLLLSTIVPNVYSAYTLVPFILIPQIILGGLFVDFDRMNPVVSDFGSRIILNESPIIASPIHARWAYEMLVTANLDLNPQEKLYRRENRDISRIDAMETDALKKMILSDEVRTRYREAGEKLDFRLNTSMEQLEGKASGEFLAKRRNTTGWISRSVPLRSFFGVTWKYDFTVLLLFLILSELVCFVRLRKYPK